MAAYVTIQVKIKDREKFAAYAKAAGPIGAGYGATLMVRSPVLEVFKGESKFDQLIMLQFPDADTARSWFKSDVYQSLAQLRDQGADVVISLMGSSA